MAEVVDSTPTLHVSAGGRSVVAALIDAFYNRVSSDDLLSPFFRAGSAAPTATMSRHGEPRSSAVAPAAETRPAETPTGAVTEAITSAAKNPISRWFRVMSTPTYPERA
jgi:hypothetical protein